MKQDSNVLRNDNEDMVKADPRVLRLDEAIPLDIEMGGMERDVEEYDMSMHFIAQVVYGDCNEHEGDGVCNKCDYRLVQHVIVIIALQPCGRQHIKGY